MTMIIHACPARHIGTSRHATVNMLTTSKRRMIVSFPGRYLLMDGLSQAPASHGCKFARHAENDELPCSEHAYLDNGGLPAHACMHLK